MTAIMNTENTVVDILSSMPESFRELSEEQLKHVLLSVKMDQYKTQVKSEVQKSEFDLQDNINFFLEGKAKDTKRMYSLYLNSFITYLDGKSLLDVNFKTVDLYKYSVLSNYSSGKAKLILSVLSSFYSMLCRHEWVERNPFLGVRIKNTKIVPEIKHLPSEKEIENILEMYNSDSKADKKMKLAIHIMTKYAVRVGFFNKEFIKYDGKTLSSMSKGKFYSVNVEGDAFIAENSELLPDLNGNSVQTSFRRTIGILYKNREIMHKYTPHDYRHMFACKLYSKTKDIYLVSKALHHASVTVTEKYLRGLEVIV
jgi:site-specific recombinase XerD